MVKVCKFGGSSVANAAQLRRVRDIVAESEDRRIVVVSAPGKRAEDDVKVTDLLINCAQAVLAGEGPGPELSAVVERYAEIVRDLKIESALVEEIEADLKDRLSRPIVNRQRFVDAVKAAGEDYCARLTASFFNATGLPARYLEPREAGLLLTEEYGEARVLEVSCDHLKKLKETEQVIVFPGFYGYTPSGHLVTFSRGGSDITGAILAAAVDAEVYENWTDVDGIFVADPKIIPHPPVIAEITYRELRELAYAGFRVFHDEAMAPVVRTGTPVQLRNTNNPSARGTMVLPDREVRRGGVVGVACDPGFAIINVTKYLMNREKGFGRRLFQIVEEANCSFEHSPTGIDSIAVVIRQNQIDERVEKLIKERIQKELEADSIEIEHNLALVAVVGLGMKHTLGICSRAATALANAEVNIEMINQGPSEISIIFGIQAADGPTAIRALAREFFGR